jgi:hypothetical protein
MISRGTLSDIPQITSKFVEIVPPSHHQGNCIPFAVIRWHDFSNRPALGRPFGHFSRHLDTSLLSHSPRRRFPRPTPERVFVAIHRSAAEFPETGSRAQRPPLAGSMTRQSTPRTHWKSAALPWRTPISDIGTGDRVSNSASRCGKELLVTRKAARPRQRFSCEGIGHSIWAPSHCPNSPIPRPLSFGNTVHLSSTSEPPPTCVDGAVSGFSRSVEATPCTY